MSYTPEVITLLSLDIIFFIIACICFFLSIKIVRNWNINATTSLQYALEKRAILVATFVKYIFVLKLPLFLFFIFSADKISHVITGAMCAAGVVNSVDFGHYLIFLKLFNIYLFGFWLSLHVKDMKDKTRALTKLKFTLFCIAFFFLSVEIFYEISFFSALDIDKIVSCCGTLFSVASTSSFSAIFDLSNTQVLSVFYIVFFLHVNFLIRKNDVLILASSVVFLVVSIIALILFFGTYIYELPTHHCPFCFLQKDYYYVGYLIYITLFNATFFSLSGAILNLIQKGNTQKSYNISLIFTIIFTALISAYPIIYYLKNGVWL